MSTSLTAAQKHVVQLAAGEYFTVAGQCEILIEYSGRSRLRKLGSADTESIGPYAVAAVITITATGAVTVSTPGLYTLPAASLTAPQVSGIQAVVSGAGIPGDGHVANLLDYYIGGPVGTGNDDKAAFFAALADASGSTLEIPARDILLDNTVAPITVTGFNGVISGNGKLVGASLDRSVLELVDCNGIAVRGLRLKYLTDRTNRNGAQLLTVRRCQNVTIESLQMTNGNSSALLVEECKNVILSNIKMRGFGANGILATNTTNLIASKILGIEIEDAVFELSRYDSLSGFNDDCSNVFVTGLIAQDSYVGALFNSCRRAFLTDYLILNTKYQGIVIRQDDATTTEHYPDEIHIGKGLIEGSGYGVPAGDDPTEAQSGIIAFTSTEIEDLPNGLEMRITLDGIKVKRATGDGIQIQESRGFVIDGGSVAVSDVGRLGARLGSKRTALDSLTVERSNQFGLYSVSGDTLDIARVRLRNVQLDGVDDRAMLLQSMRRVCIGSIVVEDDQAVPTGYRLSDAGVDSGEIGHCTSRIDNGALEISNGSPGLVYRGTEGRDLLYGLTPTTASANTAISGGAVVFSGAASGAVASIALPVVIGRRYRVVYSVTGLTGTVGVDVGGASTYQNITANGLASQDIVCAGGAAIYVVSKLSTTTGRILLLSVQELP